MIMRPVELIMQSFGSYGDKTVIRFDEAKENLFLITGDTGAGKSTIFDAIVFALYGQGSSVTNPKDGPILQSHYADPSAEPYVELTFTEKQGEHTLQYHVRRTPRYRRLKMRGAGKGRDTIDVTGSVELTMPDGSLYPAKETDGKLVSVIGLTREQFMQVAMIAQGEFMELLRAKSDDKRPVFRKLFHTELYERIVSETRKRQRESSEAVQKLLHTAQTEAGGLQIRHSGTLPEADTAAVQNLISLKGKLMDGQISSLPAFTECLRAYTEELEEELSVLRSETQKAAAERDQCREREALAESILQLFRQKEEAETILLRLEELEKQIKSDQQTFPLIYAAREISGMLQLAADAVTSLEQTKNELSLQQKRLPELVSSAERCERTGAEAAAEDDRMASVLGAVQEQTTRAKTIFAKQKELQKQRKQLEERCREAEQTYKSAAAALRSLEEEQKRWHERQQELSASGEHLQRVQVQCEQASQIRRSLDKVKGLQAEGKELDRKRKLARDTYLKKRTAYMEAAEKYELQYRLFLDEQAGLLAASLQDGSPCPVCGSIEHPHPADLTGSKDVPDRTYIEQLGKEKEQLGSALEQEAAAVKTAQALFDEKLEQYQREKQSTAAGLFKLTKEEGDPDHISFAELTDSLNAAAAKLTEEKTFYTGQYQESRELSRKIAEAAEKRLQLHEAEQSAAALHSRLMSQLEGVRASYDELTGTAGFRDEQEADDLLQQAKQNRQKSAHNLEQAQNALKAVREELASCEALIRKYTQQLPQLEAAASDRQAACHKKLDDYRLTEDQVQVLMEEWPEQVLKERQKAAEDFEKDRAAALARRDSALKQIGKRDKPDADLMKQALEKAENIWNDLLHRQEELNNICTGSQMLFKRLQKLCLHSEELLQSYGLLTELDRLLSGNKTGSRMDIETYVQRCYMERILQSANRRFDLMSGGEFELHLVGEDQAGVGRNRGLDLMVVSHITGREREVRSLSGGESFMAALSLALGMSDQIRASSAAVHPDILFIDEGFGSLDDLSREQAVRVLRQMAGGDRLVGIISHVSALKQEIDDQLVVSKSASGSHVYWKH